MVRTSVTHSAAPRVPLFCSYHILTSSVIYYRTDAWQHGIYLLNCPCMNDLKVAVNVHKGYSLPNCFISPADIITPILPRVSAIT